VLPRDRPTFDRILADLSGPVKDQVNSGTFERQPPFNRRAFSGGSSSSSSDSSSSADGSFGGIKSEASSRLRKAPSAQLEAAAGSGSAAPPPPPGPPPPGARARGHVADGAAVVGFGSEMGQAAERRLSLAVGEHTRNPMMSAATGDGGASRLSQRLSQHNQPLQHAGIEVAETS